jgi:hypothetical protein
MQNYYRPEWWEVWIKRNYAQKLRNFHKAVTK